MTDILAVTGGRAGVGIGAGAAGGGWDWQRCRCLKSGPVTVCGTGQATGPGDGRMAAGQGLAAGILTGVRD